MTAPVPTQRPYDFHPGDEQSRDAALRAHYGRLPGRRRRPPLRLTGAGYGLPICLGFALIEVALGFAFAWGQGWRP